MQGAREGTESLATEQYNVFSPLFEEAHKDFWKYAYFPPEGPSQRLQCHELGY